MLPRLPCAAVSRQCVQLCMSECIFREAIPCYKDVYDFCCLIINDNFIFHILIFLLNLNMLIVGFLNFFLKKASFIYFLLINFLTNILRFS